MNYKTSVLRILSLSLLLASCKERGFNIIQTGTASVVDTTYLITPEAPQTRNVLVEEYTGVHCSNCPAGAAILDSKSTQNPGRVLVIGMHDGPQTEPFDISKYDFRKQKVSDLLTSYFGEKADKPAGCFDRTRYQNKFFSDKTTFAGLIDKRLQIPSIANVSIFNSFDEKTRTVTIKVRVSYTASTSQRQNLSISIIENNLIDMQELSSGYDTFYIHKHVFRDMITPVSGVAILTKNPSKEAGRVYERTFTYVVDKNWVAENCQIVAFVHNDEGDDKEVLQAAETNLKP